MTRAIGAFRTVLNVLDRRRLYERVLGGLATAAIGDALGAPTEACTRQEIAERYGGLVRTLAAPGADAPAAGNRPGQITDDASQMLALAEALISGGGDLRAADWARALHRWLRTSSQGHLAGPTTREMLERSGQGAPERPERRSAVLGATNGAAMRVAPAGLVRPGDIEGAVRLAWTTCEPTHDTQVAAAGAGAIAAGVAHALTPEADVFSVVQACRAGAVLGERIGISEGRRVPAPSVARRIDLAVNEVLRTASLKEAIAAVGDTVGTGIMTAESVPAAVGLFLAAAGDPLDAASCGASIGNDTDSIATMAGALAGTLRGNTAVPADLVDQVCAANQIDLEAVAGRLTDLAHARLAPGAGP